MGFDIDLNFEMVSWNIKTEKKLRSVLVTEHAKLGLVKNCLNSIMLSSKRDNITFHANV